MAAFARMRCAGVLLELECVGRGVVWTSPRRRWHLCLGGREPPAQEVLWI